MRLKLVEFLATLLINSLHLCRAESFLSCASRADSCPGDNKFCNATSEVCECFKGFTMVGKDCVIPLPNPRHTAIIITAIICTLALIVIGLVLVIRKYNLVEYLRNKINGTRSHEVMYEDVMIGQDDPPLNL